MENFTYEWYDLVGNVGVALIVYSYFLLQRGKLRGRSIKYQLYNIIGPGLIMVSLMYNFNLSSFIIEVVWISISLYGLGVNLLKEDEANSK